MSVFVCAETYLDGFLVRSPFDTDLPSRARQIGGNWRADLKAWWYPEEQRATVHQLYLEFFGEGIEPGEEKLITLTLPEGISDSWTSCKGRSLSFKVAGIEIARAWGRDSGATLKVEGMVMSGGFSGGGSKKNPCITAIPGTSLKLKAPIGWIERAKLEEGILIQETA